jgi:hypothetical protein
VSLRQQLRQNIEAVTPDRRLSNYLRDWLRKLAFLIPIGTADGQVMRWNSTERRWEAVSDITIASDGTVGVGVDPSGDTVFPLRTGPALEIINTDGGSLLKLVDGEGEFSQIVQLESGNRLGFFKGSTLIAEITADNRLKMVDGSFLEDVATLTPDSTVDVDPADGQIQLLTLDQNTTITLDNFQSGDNITLQIDDGSSYTVTWPTISWIGGSAPTLATSGWNVIVLWKAGSTLFGSFAGST